ncbi:FHA domain-containing protein [Plectonema radiosum NIES-515]|uniref:FHA domain-containing protein n=1 Tax=Plectonema radiosum NIES-515 TaxID=2986073 RepID=A0ABT3B2S7_9CYAN|nr:FHA domain-containing protein [Plectonema radiosum]MCV3215666.1 FHA domain-containing protein [Plectonema radiosum NIES-515]
MHSVLPFLEIQPPDGEIQCKLIESDRLTVGRDSQNDIELSNEQKTISRKHCVFECQNNSWWIVDDNPSANGTFLQRGESKEIDVRKDGRLRLQDKDTIIILDRLLEPDIPVYWKLTFRQPHSDITNQIQQFQRPYLAYSFSQKKLWRMNGTTEEIKLRRQVLKLIDCMAQKNKANNNQPVVCSSEDLIKAIFNDGFERNNDLIHLVWEFRKKVESDSGEPEFIITEGRQGYSFKVKLLD